MPQQKRKSAAAKRPRVKFEFVRSPQYRVVHVDGAWGGLTPQGNISMDVFNEHGAAPDDVTYELQEDGFTPIEVGRSGGNKTIREVEATLVFNLGSAVAIQNWLTTKIKDLQDALEQLQQQERTS